jgi:hypothetical protein
MMIDEFLLFDGWFFDSLCSNWLDLKREVFVDGSWSSPIQPAGNQPLMEESYSLHDRRFFLFG